MNRRHQDFQSWRERQWYWAFVMVLSWSRLLSVEFIRRADVATFIHCHFNAFERFSGPPRVGLFAGGRTR